MAEEKKTFEDAMERLEQIVHLLETGEVSLDKSLSYFAEGVELVKYCGDELDRAEQKIRVLVKNGEGSYDERPFTDNKG